MTSLDIPNLLSQLDLVRRNVPNDERARKSLIEAARKTALALEEPGDTIQRISYSALQLAVARAVNHINLFDSIVNRGTVTTKQIAEEKGVNDVLLARLLRCMASHGMLEEINEDTWAATNISKALSLPGLKAGVNHNFDTVMPCFQQLPKFLADTNFQNPSDGSHCPWQLAHATDQSPFDWLMSHPSNFEAFTQWMTAQHEGQPIWLDVFPFKDKFSQDLTAKTLLFVDIGGGVGHQCAALKAQYPDTPGRIILQDLPQTVPHMIPIPGVEHTAYDFWTPQPIKGARAYYLRNILHDWPDDKCIQILKNTVEAMGESSVILIDEMIIPSTGTHYLAATLDLLMMSAHAGMERSEKQWRSLLDAAGLKIETTYAYTEETRDSIIVAVPK